MPWEPFRGDVAPRRPTLRHPPPPVNIFDIKIDVKRRADRTYTCVIPGYAVSATNPVELMFDILRGVTAVNVPKQAIMRLREAGLSRAGEGADALAEVLGVGRAR